MEHPLTLTSSPVNQSGGPQNRQRSSYELDNPQSGKVEQRSSSESDKPQSGESTKSRKVLMISRTEKSYGRYAEIRLYMLDLDSDSHGYGHDGDEFKHIQPGVRIKLHPNRSHQWACCRLGSALYLFDEGMPLTPRANLSVKTAAKINLTPKLLELAMAVGDSVVKGDDVIEKLPDMHQIKSRTEALPAPDGRHILVFSTEFLAPPDPPYFCSEFIPSIDLSTPASPDTAFEWYDTVDRKWTQLPGIPLLPFLGHTVCVNAYSFIDESHFIMDTSQGGFTLDLVSKKWARIPMWSPPHYFRGYFITLCGGLFMVCLKGAYKSEDGKFVLAERGIGDEFWTKVVNGRREYVIGASEAPVSGFPPPNTPDWVQVTFPSIYPLQSSSQEEGFCDNCTLQSEVIRDDMRGVRLLIDVRRTNLCTLRTDILRTLKLKIDYLWNLETLALFPL